MSNEIATYQMIKTKTTCGSDSNEAPTKTEIKAISQYLVIANDASYSNNELVKIDDISAMKEETRYTFSVTPTTMSFGAAGGNQSFTVTSSKQTYLNNVAQGNTTPVGHTNSIIGSGFSLSGDSVRAASNSSTGSRSGTVTVKQNETNSTKTISLTQSGDSISSYGDWVVKVSANPTTLPASGGTSTVTASASRTVHWASGDTTTETATPTLSISGTGFTLNGTTVTAANNPSESSRSCTVTATYSGKSASCTITQAGKAHVTNWVFQFQNGRTTETMSASYDGSSTTFGVVSTKDGAQCAFSASSSDSSWLTATVSGTTGVTVKATANTSESQRSGTITLTQEGSGKTITISVTQAGKPHVAVYVFTWTGSSTQQINHTAAKESSSTTYTVTSTKDGSPHGFSASSNVNWITTSVSVNTTVKLTISANPNTTMREGTITLTQNNSNKKLTIKVTQQPKEVETSYTFTFGGGATTKTLNFANTESTQDITIISTTQPTGVEVPFTIGSTPEWVTITDDDRGTHVKVTKNTTTSSRSGNCVFTQTASRKTITLNLTQAAGEAQPQTITFKVRFHNNHTSQLGNPSATFNPIDGASNITIGYSGTILQGGTSEYRYVTLPKSKFPLNFVSASGILDAGFTAVHITNVSCSPNRIEVPAGSEASAEVTIN